MLSPTHSTDLPLRRGVRVKTAGGGRQVLFAMGIDVFAHVPAQDLADVMPLFTSADGKHGSVNAKAQILANGPGVIRLNFSKVYMTLQNVRTLFPNPANATTLHCCNAVVAVKRRNV